MRSILLLAVFSSAVAVAFGQCNDLFISEYVEGSRNNHALEIYNPTNDTVELSDYRISTWLNGSATWSSDLSDTLSGILLPNSVVVLVYDRRDSGLFGKDTAVYEALQLKANIWLGKSSGSMLFDGDDAVSLDKRIAGEFFPIDIVGKIGQKPELSSQINGHTGWTDTFPFSTGIGTAYTKNHSLIRQQQVKRGVNVNPAYFDPSKEWLLYPNDMFDSLGSHRCDCNKYPAGLANHVFSHIAISPNPASKDLSIKATFYLKEVLILDAFGRVVSFISIADPKFATETFHMDLTNYAAGIYHLRVIGINGQVIEKRFVKTNP